ncbi:BON domain-containing protein [Streptomyces sp. BBFR51]|uniref:BON domain-containing protein n=1 Tax=Streptomyces sp. BBFR51 TaxID=3372856 RepID=UPI0037DCA4F9
MSDPAAHQGPAASDVASAAENVEYRVAHLHDRLAAEELGELGVRAEIRADAVAITGTVPSAECRETLLRITHEELAGLTVHTDVVVAENTGPDHAEEL